MAGPTLPRTVLSAALLVAGCLALSGCAAPAYRFEASSAGDLVFRLPRSWTTVQSGVPALSDGSTPPAGTWLALIDSAGRPSLAHVQANSATEPIAIAETIVVTKDVGKAITMDQLRDVGTPVTPAGRAQAILSGDNIPPVTLISDRSWRSANASGVHLIYEYMLASGPEKYDKVAVTNTSKTRVHMMLVHCTGTCFTADQAEISAAIASFTVRTP